MMNISIQEIRDMMEKPQEAILQCEAAFSQKVEAIGEQLLQKQNGNLLLLAGPSSSGKTTVTRMMANYLLRQRYPVTVVSLDNFYKAGNRHRDVPCWEDGSPNYEAPDSLDQDEIRICITSLLEGGLYEMPHFDFTTRTRYPGAETLSVPRGGYLLVEGLHALNPLVTDACGGIPYMGVFAGVATSVTDEDGTVILSAEDVRFVRRLVRDAHFRDSAPYQTFEAWPYVLKGEELYINPFRERADIRLDTFHCYEPCIFRRLVMEELAFLRDRELSLLNGQVVSFAEYANGYAQQINRSMARFPIESDHLVPKTSLLNEFVPANRVWRPDEHPYASKQPPRRELYVPQSKMGEGTLTEKDGGDGAP